MRRASTFDRLVRLLQATQSPSSDLCRGSTPDLCPGQAFQSLTVADTGNTYDNSETNTLTGTQTIRVTRVNSNRVVLIA
jgi:hypothetical protein